MLAPEEEEVEEVEDRLRCRVGLEEAVEDRLRCRVGLEEAVEDPLGPEAELARGRQWDQHLLELGKPEEQKRKRRKQKLNQL